MTPLVQVDRISKTFDKDGRPVEALREVSFDVRRGELLALMVLAILVNAGVNVLERRFLKWRLADATDDGGGL